MSHAHRARFALVARGYFALQVFRYLSTCMSTEYIWEEVDIDPMVALGVVAGIAAGVDLAGLDYSLLLAFFCSQYSVPIKNDKAGKLTTSRPRHSSFSSCLRMAPSLRNLVTMRSYFLTRHSMPAGPRLRPHSHRLILSGDSGHPPISSRHAPKAPPLKIVGRNDFNGLTQVEREESFSDLTINRFPPPPAKDTCQEYGTVVPLTARFIGCTSFRGGLRSKDSGSTEISPIMALWYLKMR